MRSRWNWGALVLAVFALLLLTSSCTLSPLNHVKARLDLEAGFPGFRIAKLAPVDSMPLSFDTGGMSAFRFRLESERVPGFALVGLYYLRVAGLDRQEQREAIRNTIFNGQSMEPAELVALERAWIAAYPGSPVSVDIDSATGNLAVLDVEVEPAPQYEGLNPADLYLLQSDWDFHFFKLDRRDTKWEYLKDYRIR